MTERERERERERVRDREREREREGTSSTGSPERMKSSTESPTLFASMHLVKSFIVRFKLDLVNKLDLVRFS